MEHDLKVWPEFFTYLANCSKTFEVRKADRPFALGDTLRLREFCDVNGYTGRELVRRVTYILDANTPAGVAFGLQPGYVAMGLAYEPAPANEPSAGTIAAPAAAQSPAIDWHRLVTPAPSPMRCRIHGPLNSSRIFAGVQFCDACLAEKFLELGIPPVFNVNGKESTSETRAI